MKKDIEKGLDTELSAATMCEGRQAAGKNQMDVWKITCQTWNVVLDRMPVCNSPIYCKVHMRNYINLS